MPKKKVNNRNPIDKGGITKAEVYAKIYEEIIPKNWRKGQFIFNRASELYGDNFVRQLPHDPFYNDANIDLFMTELTDALNKLN